MEKIGARDQHKSNKSTGTSAILARRQLFFSDGESIFGNSQTRLEKRNSNSQVCNEVSISLIYFICMLSIIICIVLAVLHFVAQKACLWSCFFGMLLWLLADWGSWIRINTIFFVILKKFSIDLFFVYSFLQIISSFFEKLVFNFV